MKLGQWQCVLLSTINSHRRTLCLHYSLALFSNVNWVVDRNQDSLISLKWRVVCPSTLRIEFVDPHSQLWHCPIRGQYSGHVRPIRGQCPADTGLSESDKTLHKDLIKILTRLELRGGQGWKQIFISWLSGTKNDYWPIFYLNCPPIPICICTNQKWGSVVV